MTEVTETIGDLRDALRLSIEKCRRLQAELTRLTQDVRAAREVAQAIARKYGFTWNDGGSLEGFMRNMVCIVEQYRKLIEERK